VRRRLVISYVAVAAVILLTLEVPLWLVYARHERDVASVGVTHDATALASLVDEGIESRSTASLEVVADHYRGSVTGDLEIVDRSGQIVVPPRAHDSVLTDPAIRAELLAVIHGAPGGLHAVGHSDDLIAFEPVGSVDSPVAAVVVAANDDQVDHRVHDASLALMALAAGVMSAVALLGLVVARSVTKPLTHLENAARRLGGDDLTARAPAEVGPAEVRAVSAAFNDMAGRLEELVVAQRGFVADASHQLRSPLTALRLRLENIAAAVPNADADGVLAELERLSRVVDGLLTLARSEGQRPQRLVIDVSTVVADRVDAWSPLAEEAGIALAAVQPPDSGHNAWMVPGHLEQILDNLLANALDATPPGRSVRVSVRPDGDSVEVRVTDEGKGMAQDDRRHAFDRFWRGTGSKPGAGSGLGLAIVHQLVRASAANITLEEAPTGGIDAVLRVQASRPEELTRQRP
jgi:signal transduction histidine kinase